MRHPKRTRGESLGSELRPEFTAPVGNARFFAVGKPGFVEPGNTCAFDISDPRPLPSSACSMLHVEVPKLDTLLIYSPEPNQLMIASLDKWIVSQHPPSWKNIGAGASLTTLNILELSDNRTLLQEMPIVSLEIDPVEPKRIMVWNNATVGPFAGRLEVRPVVVAGV